MNILVQMIGKIRPWICVVVILGMFGSMAANAQVPPRFYWKTLQGTSAVPVIALSASGNVNPLDPSLILDPSASLSADVAIAGYAKMFPVWNKAAMLAVLVPMGRIEGDFLRTGGLLTREASSGFGDPMVEFNINLIGPPPIMNLPDLLRYEPGFSLDLIVDLAFPLGQNDNTQSLNLGQNRWYGRIGAPIVWQLGPWIPAPGSCDLGYVDGRFRGSAGYNRIIRVRSTHEQLSSFGTPEHGGKDGSFCRNLLVDFSALPDTQSLRTCASDPNGSFSIETDSVRFNVVLQLSPHSTILQ